MEAAKKIVPILVDCDWGRKNTDISQRYSIRGYPTVLFVDAKGELVESLKSRAPEDVMEQINEFAKKHGGGPIIEMEESLEKGLAAAKKADMPVLLFFDSGKDDAKDLLKVLGDEQVSKILKSFVLIRHEFDKDCQVCKESKAYRGSMILLLDPAVEEPTANPLATLTGKKTSKSLASLLDKALEEFQESRRKDG